MSCNFLLSPCKKSDIFLTMLYKTQRTIAVCIFRCVPISQSCVCLSSFKKITEAFVFVDQQHFVNKEQHLFLWIRNDIWLAFVLTVQFIAITANKTYIKCKIDEPVNLGEPPISARTCGHGGVQTRLEQELLLWYNSSWLIERRFLVECNKAVIFGLWRVQFKIHQELFH